MSMKTAKKFFLSLGIITLLAFCLLAFTVVSAQESFSCASYNFVYVVCSWD